MIIKNQVTHQGKIPSINSVKLGIHPMRMDLALIIAHFVVNQTIELKMVAPLWLMITELELMSCLHILIVQSVPHTLNAVLIIPCNCVLTGKAQDP